MIFTMDNNDVIQVAENLYYEANPNSKMDVPSFVYEKIEGQYIKWRSADSELSLYEWCKNTLKK